MNLSKFVFLLYVGFSSLCLNSQRCIAQSSSFSHAHNQDVMRSEYTEPAEMPMNAVFLEAGGPGLIESINYERMITKSVGVRIGWGFAVPVLVNYYFGETYRFELGAGASFVLPRISDLLNLGGNGTTIYTMTIGHKYQPQQSAFMLRYSITPLYSPAKHKGMFWIGISGGYAF